MLVKCKTSPFLVLRQIHLVRSSVWPENKGESNGSTYRRTPVPFMREFWSCFVFDILIYVCVHRVALVQMQKQNVGRHFWLSLDIMSLAIVNISSCELLGGEWCGNWLSWVMTAFNISDMLLLSLEHLCRNQNPLRWWLAWDVRKLYLNLQRETLNPCFPQQKWKSLTSEILLGDGLSCKLRYVGTRLPY